MQLLHPDAPVALLNGIIAGPGDVIIGLPLALQLGQIVYRGVKAHQLIPGGLTDDAVYLQIEYLLKFSDGGFGLFSKDAVNRGDFRDCRIVFPDSVQLRLNNHHIGTDISPAQRCAGIGGCIFFYRRVIDDFHIAVVIPKNLGGVIALLRQLLTAPLAQALAGHGGAVAVFCSQGLHEARAAQIVVEHLLRQAGDVCKIASTINKVLVVGRIVGDVKIIPPAAVKLGVNPVQGKGNNGQDVGPEGTFIPGGVDFTGSHILDIVHEINGYIWRVVSRRSQMDRYFLRYIRDNCRHDIPPYRFCGGVTTYALSVSPRGSWERGIIFKS